MHVPWYTHSYLHVCVCVLSFPFALGLAGRYFDKMNFKRFNDIFPSDIDALKKWDGFKLSWINVAFFVSGLLVNVYCKYRLRLYMYAQWHAYAGVGVGLGVGLALYTHV